MEHEYYTGLSLLIMVYIAIKKFGPSIAAWLDKEVDVRLFFLNLCDREMRGLDRRLKDMWTRGACTSLEPH